MAKTYAESVKLPNLIVSVTHPSSKCSNRNNNNNRLINIEGNIYSSQHNSFSSQSLNNQKFSTTNSQVVDRRDIIKNLIGNFFYH
jgi:hypothetical protein